MRKPTFAVAALALIFAVAPVAGHADHCNSSVVMWGQPYGVQANGLGCAADGGEDTDLRVFLPGTFGATVGYFPGACEIGTRIDVTIGGSLWTAPFVGRLNCIAGNTPGTTNYQGGPWNWPGGRTAVGCMTATVHVAEEEFPTNTWRTATATC